MLHLAATVVDTFLLLCASEDIPLKTYCDRHRHCFQQHEIACLLRRKLDFGSCRGYRALASWSDDMKRLSSERTTILDLDDVHLHQGSKGTKVAKSHNVSKIHEGCHKKSPTWRPDYFVISQNEGYTPIDFRLRQVQLVASVTSHAVEHPIRPGRPRTQFQKEVKISQGPQMRSWVHHEWQRWTTVPVPQNFHPCADNVPQNVVTTILLFMWK